MNRPYLQGINESPSRVLAQTFSDPFTVFSAKKFPGMIGKSFPQKEASKIQPIDSSVRNFNCYSFIRIDSTVQGIRTSRRKNPNSERRGKGEKGRTCRRRWRWINPILERMIALTAVFSQFARIYISTSHNIPPPPDPKRYTNLHPMRPIWKPVFTLGTIFSSHCAQIQPPPNKKALCFRYNT